MPCEPRYEISTDAHGVQTRRLIRESFQDFEPNAEADSNTKSREGPEGGKYTIVEEQILNAGTAHYSVEVGNSTEPIETNYRYSQAFNEDWEKEELRKWKIWKNNPSDTEVLNWSPKQLGAEGSGYTTSWAVVEFFNFWAQGITDYYEPKVTLKMEIIEETPPALNGIGLIQGAGIYPGGEDLGERNFLYIGASGRQQGKWWHNTYEYLLSGKRGWNADLYGDVIG